jgi:hypothetical protein
MAALIKIVNKDINRDRLNEELDAAGLLVGITWTGFDRLNRRIMTPSTVHGFTAGELRFKYEPPISAGQEATLDGILAAHDSAQRSTLQIAGDQDEIDRQAFITTFNEWDTLNNTQKVNRIKHLFRVVARLVDSTTDL